MVQCRGRSIAAHRRDRGYGEARRERYVRRSRVRRPRRPRRDHGRPPAGEFFRERRRRSRPGCARPAKLCAGRAGVGARVRSSFDVRHSRRARLCRRHSGHATGRPGPAHQHRFELDGPHRSAARAVLRALRQFLGRRHPGVHRDGLGRAHAHVGCDRRQLRLAETGDQDRRRHRLPGLRRELQRVPDRRLPRPQRGGARHRQREARLEYRRGGQAVFRREHARPAEGAGSVGAHAGAVRRESARRRSPPRSNSTRARPSTRRKRA